MFKMRDLQTGVTANSTFQQVQQMGELIAEQKETNRLLRLLVQQGQQLHHSKVGLQP